MKNRYIFLILLITFIIGFLSGGFYHKREARLQSDIDTVTIWIPATMDSIPRIISTILAPDSIPSVKILTEKIKSTEDSTTVAVRPDIVTVAGTLTGGLSYKAQLLGIQPQLNSLEVIFPQTTVTKTRVKPYQGWIFSTEFNTQAFFCNNIQSISTISLQTSYNYGRFHAGLYGGIAAFQFPASRIIKPYVGARITFDISRMR